VVATYISPMESRSIRVSPAEGALRALDFLEAVVVMSLEV
jgi:hypothetical protein